MMIPILRPSRMHRPRTGAASSTAVGQRIIVNSRAIYLQKLRELRTQWERLRFRFGLHYLEKGLEQDAQLLHSSANGFMVTEGDDTTDIQPSLYNSRSQNSRIHVGTFHLSRGSRITSFSWENKQKERRKARGTKVKIKAKLRSNEKNRPTKLCGIIWSLSWVYFLDGQKISNFITWSSN